MSAGGTDPHTGSDATARAWEPAVTWVIGGDDKGKPAVGKSGSGEAKEKQGEGVWQEDAWLI